MRRITGFLFLITCGLVTGQSSWSSWSGQGPQTNDLTFWMDSASQCSAKQFNVGTSPITIYGKGAVQSNPGSLTECQITLISEKTGEVRRFRVEIKQATINEQNVAFTMYDGQSTGSNRLFTASKGSPPNTQIQYTTSGNSVTFYFTRSSPANLDFNIEISVLAIPGDPTSQNECETGNEYGCNFYSFKQVIDKETVIGIVGGIFGLIIFIVIPIIVICCYRRSKGVNKKWDEFKLHDTVTNTAADIHNSQASLTTTKSKKDPWTSQSSRAPYSDVKRSYGRGSRYSDGGDSEFSASIDIPPKGRPPPPPYDEHDRGRSYRDGPRSNRNGYRDDRNRNDRYDDRVDRDYRSERNSRPRYESDRKSYYSSSDDASYVQGRDDHPQEVFIERVIEPRVKPKSKAELQKRAKYEEDDEDPYDKIVDRDSPKLKPKKTVKESAIQCEQESSEDNESNTESDEEPLSTDETDDEDIIKKKKKEAQKAALYARPSKKGRKQTKAEPALPPAVVQPPQPVHMVPGQQPVFYNMQHPNGPPFPRPVPPVQQPYFTQPPHPRPFMSISGLPPQQPMGYHPPMPARFPPPAQVQRPPAPPMYNASQGAPLQPPVFTHLVQRGYGRQSPSLDGSEGGRNQTDDSDRTADLGSGVEFMKRSTTTV
ncbi:uncharacterized protein LOC143045648 [Mytilus galloprovincialis]|uniref:CUB domain-containing protein n=1 Tax=Mytilus galloprovincialis TaxID=29158 RepID=A0A8B6C1S8_MYTGA|nr:Hypothetical predicted protein [Mytilus galloprovincialis]